MRVTHVITGLSRGGAESSLYRLISAQAKPSAHSVISLTDGGVFAERLREIGTEVRCLGLQRGAVPSTVAVARLAWWLRELRPAVVQSWMYHADLLGGIAARLVGVPVCWGIRHSSLSSSHNKQSTLRVAALCARLSKFVPSRIVSCSSRAIDVHREIGYADKFELIPNGLDLSAFRPISPEKRESIRMSLGVPAEAKVIGHVARADVLKDHRTLLNAFSQIAAERQDVWLLLAGAGLEHGDAYLENLIAESSASPFVHRIRALGPRNDISEVMGAIDLFMLSSIGEAFPNVLAEAMACGTPCVATNVGDSADIVGATGWICDPGDANGLACAAISGLAQLREASQLRREDARQRVVDNFAIERTVRAYDTVWRNVLQR